MAMKKHEAQFSRVIGDLNATVGSNSIRRTSVDYRGRVKRNSRGEINYLPKEIATRIRFFFFYGKRKNRKWRWKNSGKMKKKTVNIVKAVNILKSFGNRL